MLDFLIRHQTDVMLLLGGICAMTAFFVFLTDSLGKDRKVALMILEIGGMILAIFEMFSYMYRGDMSELGYWMVRVGNFMTFAMMPILMGGLTYYIHDILNRKKGQLIGRDKQIGPQGMSVSQDQGHQRFHPRVGKAAAFPLYIHQHGKVGIKPGLEMADLYRVGKLIPVEAEYGQKKHVVVKSFQLGDGHQQIIPFIWQIKRTGGMLVKWVQEDQGTRSARIISVSYRDDS